MKRARRVVEIRVDVTEVVWGTIRVKVLVADAIVVGLKGGYGVMKVSRRRNEGASANSSIS